MTEVLRLIAGGLLAIISSYVGLIVKNRYKSREKFYYSAQNFAGNLKRDIGFFEKPLPDIIREFLPSSGEEFAELLNVYLGTIKAQNADFSRLEKVKLKNGEIEELERYFSSFGKSSQSEQLTLVNSFQNMCEEKYKICKEESKRLGGTYFKLLVLLGIALMIIVA